MMLSFDRGCTYTLLIQVMRGHTRLYRNDVEVADQLNCKESIPTISRVANWLDLRRQKAIDMLYIDLTRIILNAAPMLVGIITINLRICGSNQTYLVFARINDIRIYLFGLNQRPKSELILNTRTIFKNRHALPINARREIYTSNNCILLIRDVIGRYQRM